MRCARLARTLAATVLGMMSGLAAGAGLGAPALAVYGLLDLALVREAGGVAGRTWKLSSGVSAGSRIGVRGSQALGGGTSAVFVLESGFQADTGEMGQGGLLFGRQAWVGLEAGFGILSVGRVYTPQYLTTVMADPLESGYVGDSKNLLGMSGNAFSRMDNTLSYASPALAGAVLELVVAPGESAAGGASGRQWGGALGYRAGPLRLRFGYHERRSDDAEGDGATAPSAGHARNAALGAVLDLGLGGLKLHGLAGRNKGAGSADLRSRGNPYGRPQVPRASKESRDLLLGVSVRSGAHALMVSWIRKDDRTALNQDAVQRALGYRYSLSPRTALHLSFARIVNRNGAGYTVGSAIEAGSGDRAAGIGVSHGF